MKLRAPIQRARAPSPAERPSLIPLPVRLSPQRLSCTLSALAEERESQSSWSSMATPIVIGVGAVAAALVGRQLLRRAGKSAVEEFVKGGFNVERDVRASYTTACASDDHRLSLKR